MEILLVEDNETLSKGLVYSLEQSGFSVVHKLNKKDTVDFLNNKKPNLVILDIELPDGNGFDIYEKTIKEKKIPTIFLTVKDEEDDIVKGLELGAEDYITKPFSTRELIARVNKILNKNNIIKVKNVEFDLDKMVVLKDGKEVVLTSLELIIFKSK